MAHWFGSCFCGINRQKLKIRSFFGSGQGRKSKVKTTKLKSSSYISKKSSTVHYLSHHEFWKAYWEDEDEDAQHTSERSMILMKLSLVLIILAATGKLGATIFTTSLLYIVGFFRNQITNSWKKS
ncbi:hypothetical protein Sjap_025868 [Stephania japonica]|uniref:Uncharacterized protein n=1 Tax=Stephania japonica TaxID=461633 RepID=A0AAP0E6X3_9MAGN